MSVYKRALAAYRRFVPLVRWLGFFFCILMPLQAQENSISVTGEISGAAGTLWVEDDGAVVYRKAGMAFSLSPPVFLLGFDLGQVSSSLPWFNSSVSGLRGQCGIDMPAGRLNAAFGFFTQSPVYAAIDHIVLSNDGGQGSFFSLETPLRFGSLSIVPHYLHGEAGWNDGDLYWFFGKPRIPSFHIFGLHLYYEQYIGGGRYKHGMSFSGLRADLNIISNENEPLFNTILNGGLFLYQCSLEKNKIAITGMLGWLYAGASLEGALTTSNQPYFLFPYLSYNVNAVLEAQAGFVLIRFCGNQGIFRYNVDLGAVHVFYDRVKADIHYQKKRLFGGETGYEEIFPKISGLGAAFLLLEAGIPALPLSRRFTGLRFSLGLQKAFFLPWGYEKLVSSGGGSSGDSPGPGIFPAEESSGAVTLSQIRTILLSGLSIYGALHW